MYDAYSRIFRRCGLDFRTVEADSGAIGGSKNHEFQVLADSGEDVIVACDNCDYAANVEQAELAAPGEPGIAGAQGALAEVATPGKHTIEEVSSFLAVEPRQLVKTLIYMADGQAVAVLLRGDRGLNEVKLKRLLDATELFLAREGQVIEATGAPTGFAGPVGLKIKVVADLELKGAKGAVVGGNKKDVHLTGFDIDRDAQVAEYASLRLAEAGDACPRCGKGHYRQFRGIEVGHVFYLTTVYSVPMGCTFLDEAGVEKPMDMGCYGIGITRTAAAAIEQNHDDSGIIWPISIAPYEVTVLSLQQDAAVTEAADRIYRELTERGVDVLYDDRDERPGGKFKDADLIGIPLRVAIGARSLKEGQVEVKWRRDAKPTLVPVDRAVEVIAGMVAEEKARLLASAGR
jgi:prolyl-tRNA synthetase